MSTSDPSQLDELSVTEELTAYLDGEVDAEHARRIEERLARDEGYRKQLQALQRTWDMLDQLPQARVDEGFLKSTIEMVAQAAAEDVEATKRFIPKKRNRRWLLAAIGFAGAVALGFLAGGYFWPDSDRQVLQNLPLVEDFDVYQMPNPDPQFAALLLKAGLFQEDADSKEPIPDDLSGRREWVAARPPGKQDELRRNWDRFQKLPDEQKQRVENLSAELNADPQKKQLYEIELRYRQWYTGLKPPQRDELLALEPEERVKQIAKFREPPLTREELVKVAEWYDRQLRKRVDELIPAKDRDEFDAVSPEEQRHRLWFSTIRSWHFRGRDANPPLSEGDYAVLHDELSPVARVPLDAAETTKEKWQVVQHWVFHANAYVHMLSDSERQQLQSLEGEEFYQQLREFMSRRWPGPWDRRRGDRDGNFSPDRDGNRGPARRRDVEDRDRDGRRGRRDRDDRRGDDVKRDAERSDRDDSSADEQRGKTSQRSTSSSDSASEGDSATNDAERQDESSAAPDDGQPSAPDE